MFSPYTYLNIQTIHLYEHVVFQSSDYTHIDKNKNVTIANVIPKTLTPMGNLYGNSYVVDLRPTLVRLRVMHNEVDNNKNFVNLPLY